MYKNSEKWPKNLINCEGEADIRHLMQDIIGSVPELEGQLLRGNTREVEPDLVAHVVALHGSIRTGDGDATEGVRSTCWTDVVQVTEVLAAEVHDVHPGHRYIGEVVGIPADGVWPAEQGAHVSATREGEVMAVAKPGPSYWEVGMVTVYSEENPYEA